MDCPRCNLSLRSAAYEGEQVMYCSTCWGYWLTHSQLAHIIEATMQQFTDAERDKVTETFAMVGDAERGSREADPVRCPECQRAMQRHRFADSCPVMVDECPDHGIWLDTGEIKDLQIFIERYAGS
jgi:Zn-finger nucleic acid-binding protein